MDNRAETEASELRAILGWREVSSEHLAPRLLWLARNQPDALVHPLVECVSWLTARLTGNLIVSSSIRHFLWGLEPSQVTLLLTRFPEISAGLKCLDLSVQAPHASSGFLTPASARALGITAPDVVVAAGGNDAMMCAAGAGLWNDATSVVEVGGTSYVTVSRSCSRRAVGSFLSGPDPFSRCGKLYLTSLETAGLFLDWLGSVLRVTPEEMDQIMTRAGGQVACGCQPAQGIKVGMALMRDKHGRGGGGFLRGLRPTTTRESLLLSAVEEVARQAHQRLAQLAVRSRPAIQRLILTGGFSTNAAFVQLRARQAMRLSPAIKTFTTQGGNVGCRGAAMCAACANDTFADMSAASAAMACSLDPVGVDTP